MKYIVENIKPLSLIAICGCIGYFLGSPMTGIVVGITIVAAATLLYKIMARSWIVKKVEWWKHLKWRKRDQSKKERQQSKKDIHKQL